jgi:hypothetical protein
VTSALHSSLPLLLVGSLVPLSFVIILNLANHPICAEYPQPLVCLSIKEASPRVIDTTPKLAKYH